ncbi:MAG TPA: methionine gamma-lyase [Balneolaceae bacterium]|nr:methionine gamma-lyase [Balneolaceae bacterium]|tara:strand:+ start:144230 stop:145450 length:1221 start_codon:yes stop_codon:yes gene_type:complete
MMDTKQHKISFSTTAVHAGKKEDQFGAHVSPIYQTSTFVFKDVDEGREAFSNEEGSETHIYSRLANPTVEHLERAICSLETYGMDTADEYQGMAFGSGMAAISTGILTLAKGGHVIAQDALYGCTSQFLEGEAPELGITTSFVDTSDSFLVEMELKKHPNTKLIYLESIANPTMMVSDIPRIAKLAEDYGALLMVDNTFASPYHLKPITLGADVVAHSTTKYLGGHGTVIGGALVLKKQLIQDSAMAVFRKNLGGIAGPMDAFLLTNGVKTLALRMEKQAKNTMKIARFLEAHSAVDRVWYPGLESHPQHHLANAMMSNGFGGVLAFELKGGYEAGKHLMNSVKLCSLAVSLGTVDTLIQHPASMTHAVMSEELRNQAGITEGLVRLAVGIEDAEDIIYDLEQGIL